MRPEDQIKKEAAALRRNLEATFPGRHDLYDLVQMSALSKQHSMALEMIDGAINVYKPEELTAFMKACSDHWAACIEALNES